MRHLFISDVVKELLGPRNGAVEEFPAADEPRNEYSTGQLFPSSGTGVMDRSPDEEESLGGEAAAGEDDGDDGAPTLVNQAFIDAGQNFRRVPSSMGLSFVLSRAPEDGEISVCVTWGRYQHVEGRGWVRSPFSWITTLTAGSAESSERSPDSTLQLTYKISPLRSGQIKVSIYVSSSLETDNSGRPGNEDIIFQPEIRVKLRDRSILRELGDLGFNSDDPAWRVSTRQYDRLKVYARGHLCGAYWDEIDPQRPSDSQEVDVPFRWIDGLHFLPTDERIREFLVPDLRTDFIPMYPAPAAGAGARLSVEMRADQIADCRDFNELSSQIIPLIAAYEEWVSSLRVDPEAREIDTSIISQHREAIRRIRRGVDFLREDENAFLAFLFMNKAMSKQYAWGRPAAENVMRWRPFQLAFILLALESSVRQTEDRQICDTIWFPTGGGKTEAYLGLAAFTLAYRRRVSEADLDGSRSGEGTGVISRYTLRLLTIQQFRRALKMIVACETLRCADMDADGAGWLPRGRARDQGLIWGRSPFSIGLWVGGAVTPNQMQGAGYRDFGPGAIALLNRPAQSDESDPAQILDCPCCGSILSFPLGDIPAGSLVLKLHVAGRPPTDDATLASASSNKFRLNSITYSPHASGNSGYARLDLTLSSAVEGKDIDRWWRETAQPALNIRLNSFGAARPGYIPVAGGRRGNLNDYEIRCPESRCELNALYFKQKRPDRGGQWSFIEGHPLFALPNDPDTTLGMKISALTVDEKIYGWPPSMLISTVDKLARLAFTNEAASLFGRVRSFDLGVNSGFSQDEATPTSRTRIPTSSFAPPSLIIQDELHLLDGPLGSTFGLFETAIQRLCGTPKYIASSATIRNSSEQVACLMGRRSVVFPPVGTDITEGFFLRSGEIHPLDENSPGRLFLGLAFPGRAPQTPMLRLWGRLLQTAQNLYHVAATIPEGAQRDKHLWHLDHFWTLIGYFNAVRELAQGETLIRQDIPQFLDKLQRQHSGTTKRPELREGFRNLSSQTRSSELPGILAKMERGLQDGDALSAVASTSMFGTGVDVARLSLMIVHGQPKSASQYIQAVGRIGRRRAGLAVVFFRVSKPRDLNHYEYFTGYHRKLPVAVEPITVKPLAPKAIDRAIGSILSILLRNWSQGTPSVPTGIDLEEGAALIGDVQPAMMAELMNLFVTKWEAQPERRRNDREQFLRFVRSQIERWQEYARRQRDAGQVLQYTKGNVVVLGQSDSPAAVFQNVSQSLREVEPMINLYTERD